MKKVILSMLMLASMNVFSQDSTAVKKEHKKEKKAEKVEKKAEKAEKKAEKVEKREARNNQDKK